VHHVEERIHHAVQDSVDGVGAALGWLFNTLVSGVVGLLVGAVIVALMHLLPHRRDGAASSH
jgi:predicted DNA repair protein MutK